MIRLIIRTDNAGMAVNVGGAVHTTFRTFDVDLPEVEAWISEDSAYMQTQLVGAEIVAALKAGKQ